MSKKREELGITLDTLKKLMEKTNRYYCRGFLKSYWDIVIERREGPYLFSVDGEIYADYCLRGGLKL